MAKLAIELKEIKVFTGIDLDVNYTDFQAIREEMNRIEAGNPQFTRFMVLMEGEPYSDREYPHVYGMRMETVEEATARQEQEDKNQAEREARERAEFERLTVKFS